MFGRAENEILKIAKRNKLDNIAYLASGESAYLYKAAMGIICGEIATNYRSSVDLKKRSNGLDFENSCVDVLNSLGYTTSLTKKSGDFGCDILAEKDDLVFAIQCKSSSSKIGVKAVQEAVSARRYYKADMAVVVTDSEYTSAANELAVENKVILLHESQLERLDKLAV